MEAAAPREAAPGAPALRLVGIGRRFRQGEAWLDVLRGAELALAPGAVVALMGPSGAG
jgi:lipoprotein-releasing system ATP-binding protein